MLDLTVLQTLLKWFLKFNQISKIKRHKIVSRGISCLDFEKIRLTLTDDNTLLTHSLLNMTDSKTVINLKIKE